MDNFIVYGYCREDGTFYYIGKGRPRRPYGKRKSGVKPPKDRKRILILHTGLSEETAFDYEEKLILLYGRKDLGTGLLRNMTNGGEGVAGWVPDENWRQKKSESMSGSGNPMYVDGSSLIRVEKPRESMAGENNPMYGKPRPDLAQRNKETPPAKGTEWYNNGKIDKRYAPGEEPEDFVGGRLYMTTEFHKEKNKEGKSVNSVKGAEAANSRMTPEQKTERGRKGAKALNESLTPERNSEIGRKAGEACHKLKNKDGKSVNAVKCGEASNKKKDAQGRSINAVKGAMATNASMTAEQKTERSRKASAKTNSQVWKSTIDGFISNAGVVAQHNRKNGWDPNARVKVS